MTFEIANIGIVAALLAGMISFLSPCVLPLVPGYMSYIAGSTDRGMERRRIDTVFLSGCFVLGFSTVFIPHSPSKSLILLSGSQYFRYKSWC